MPAENPTRDFTEIPLNRFEAILLTRALSSYLEMVKHDSKITPRLLRRIRLLRSQIHNLHAPKDYSC